MICPQCRREVPANDLACKTCAAQNSRAAFLVYQRQFLPAVLAGNLPIHTRRGRAGGADYHIELFGDPEHAWCGVPTAGLKRDHVKVAPFVTAPLGTCKECAELFEAACSEVSQHGVSATPSGS